MLVCDNCLHSFVCKYMDTMTPQDNCKCYRNRNGVIIIPDNATNGDMIKALFPNAYISYGRNFVVTDISEKTTMFKNEWWNAPYKENK